MGHTKFTTLNLNTFLKCPQFGMHVIPNLEQSEINKFYLKCEICTFLCYMRGSPEAKNHKTEGTLLSSTFKIEESKGPLLFNYLTSGLRYDLVVLVLGNYSKINVKEILFYKN